MAGQTSWPLRSAALVGVWLRIWVPEAPLYLQRTGQAGALRSTLNLVLRTNENPELDARSFFHNQLFDGSGGRRRSSSSQILDHYPRRFGTRL